MVALGQRVSTVGGRMTYAEYYKAKHEGALIFQDFVVDTVWRLMHIHLIVYGSKAYQFSKGEGPTAEIKHDELFKQTRRLWIEVAEKAAPRGGPYAVSGIYRQDDTWMWAQGDYDTIFLFQKLNLRAIHKSGRYNVIENRTFTSEGFLIRSEEHTSE